MRTNIHELNAVVESAAYYAPPAPSFALHSFVLPTFHPSVQIHGNISLDSAQLVRDLIATKIIKLESIPETASTVDEVLNLGLAAWFKVHMPVFKALIVSVEILTPASVQEAIRSATREDGEYRSYERRFNGSIGVQFNGDWGWNPFTVSDFALGIELTEPGLFKATMRVIKEAAAITVPIRTAFDALSDFQNLWEDDAVVPDDDAVIERLIEMLDDEANDYLPSVLIPVLGGDLCLPSLVPKKDRMSLAQIRRISKSSNDIECRDLAKQVLKLKAAIKAANKAGARLPDVDGLNIQTVEPGCTLIYQFDRRVFGVFSDQYQYGMETGYANQMIGLDEIPVVPTEITSYFNRMNLALSVLKEMDALIAMIGTPYDMQDYEGNY